MAFVTIFTRRFKADPVGTHFWHSHSGLQRADGLYGALVVREPDDPSGALYDHDLPDHVILIQDWMLMLAQTMFTGHHHSNILRWNAMSRSMIINGNIFWEIHLRPAASQMFRSSTIFSRSISRFGILRATQPRRFRR